MMINGPGGRPGGTTTTDDGVDSTAGYTAVLATGRQPAAVTWVNDLYAQPVLSVTDTSILAAVMEAGVIAQGKA